VSGPAGDLWLVFQLARKSLESGTLRDYWPGLAREGEEAGFATRGVAAVVWVALVAVIPIVAARRRRLIARALEGAVRAVVAGVEVPTALARAVDWLQRKGIEPTQARADLERLLGGFLSTSSRGAAPETSRDATSRDSGSRFTSAG
jgi:hypothetical protein